MAVIAAAVFMLFHHVVVSRLGVSSSIGIYIVLRRLCNIC